MEPASGDYRLQSTSPCVDAGEPAGTAIGTMDYDHAARLWDGDGDDIAVVDLGAWEYSAVTAQELNVLWDGVAIANGDAIPAPWDGTDFGNGEVSGAAVLRTFTIENTGVTTLHLTGDPVIEITGLNAADFRVVTQPVSVLDGGESISFTIEFIPMDLELREAIIKLNNDDGDENPFTFTIQGTGVPLPFRVYLPLILAVN